MDFKTLDGKAEMRLGDMFGLMEKAKFYDEAYDKVHKALQMGLQEMVMSLARTVKGEAPDVRIIVDPFDSAEVIDDIVNRNRILHVFLKMEQAKEVSSTGTDIVVIIKTGFREEKK